MIVLLDNGQDLDQCATELGCEVGQLLTPLTRYKLRDPARPWAIDNGAFARFDHKAFASLLRREEHRRDACKFVCVPDVVGSARRTCEVFERWKDHLIGWKTAFVCQDGQEDLPIPWDDCDAVFIGGSTNWKGSAHVEQIVRTALILEKWVHVGRVNTEGRFRAFEEMGVHSVDGSGIAQYSHMRTAVARRHDQSALELEGL